VLSLSKHESDFFSSLLSLTINRRAQVAAGISSAVSADNGFYACCARARAGRAVQRPSQAWAVAALDTFRFAIGASIRTEATFKSATTCRAGDAGW